MKMKSILCILLLVALQPAFAEDLPDNEFLKVCADPYMLPFSNKNGEGYENKIAELLAQKLGLKLKYEFFPQRIGFIRNTLKAESDKGVGFKCDLVIGVPSNFELAATTDPYFTSAYVLVYVKGRQLDSIKSPEMLSQLINQHGHEDIKIGLSDRGAAQLWVFNNDLLANVTPYQGQTGNPKLDPQKHLINELIADKIDATIVWGATAGFYAKKYKSDNIQLVLLPLKDDKENPEVRFNYSFSMAVRFGENAWKEKLNQLIKDNKVEIEKILLDYGVPLIK